MFDFSSGLPNSKVRHYREHTGHWSTESHDFSRMSMTVGTLLIHSDSGPYMLLCLWQHGLFWWAEDQGQTKRGERQKVQNQQKHVLCLTRFIQASKSPPQPPPHLIVAEQLENPVENKFIWEKTLEVFNLKTLWKISLYGRKHLKCSIWKPCGK